MTEMKVRTEQIPVMHLNYLLVMPRVVQNIGDGYSFALGITYISASMKKAGYKVIALNLNHHAGEVDDLIKRAIEENQIDMVATGGLSFQYHQVKRVVEAAKSVNPKIITVVGGGIISGDPEAAMTALEYADFGVIGEGELTINELCASFEQGGDSSKIEGIIYKNGNSYVATRPRGQVMEIDSLPWPDYDGFEIDKYLKLSPPGISGMNEENTISMLASRSCPFNCTFCFHTTGRKYRQRSLDGFFNELDYLVSHYNIKFIFMADELFAHDLKRVKEFCEKIRGYNVRWWAQFRVGDVTPELLSILKEGGCRIMSFGLESADNRILKSMRKGITIEQTERALKLVYEQGITPEGAFIFGDIEETWETANNTLGWWREHLEYKINLNLITVYPGSFLYQYACSQGIIKDRAQFLKDGCPQVNVSKLSDKEYSVLIREILEAPLTMTKVLEQTEVEIIDNRSGRVAITGVCSVCKNPNTWENVKLFASGFLACSNCGQRFNLVIPDKILAALESNIRDLLSRYGKLAVWGINYHATNLFKRSTALKTADIFAVDISNIKQMMDLYGKKINPPEVLNKKQIEAVIIPIPVYYNEIAASIKSTYKNVKEIIDICELISPDWALRK